MCIRDSGKVGDGDEGRRSELFGSLDDGGGDEGKGVGEDGSCSAEEGRSTMKRRQDLILKRLHALTLIELVVV